MAWEEELEPDWIYEMPFYLAATIAYGALLTFNPTMRWGGGKSPAEAGVPIEFVAQLPAPSPAPDLAPPPPAGEGRAEPAPQKGPGEYEAEKIKAGAQDAPPAALPKPKPAAVKSAREKRGATAAKPKPTAKPAVAKTVKAAPKPVDVTAIMAASVARRAQADRAKEAKAAAAAAAAEAARARRERLAAAQAAKAAKKAELSQELATMNDPDAALAQDAGSPTADGLARAKAKTGADGGDPPADGAALAGARKAGAAAALADASESADPGDAAGSGGADLLDAKAKGGGSGPDGSGVSYSLDGPVGSRRVLRRTVPASPDWVGTRGLDLTVAVRFQVLPDGSVKPGAVIKKTSGFPEIDRLALDALRKWRFEAAPSSDGPEVWGRVTFRFTS